MKPEQKKKQTNKKYKDYCKADNNVNVLCK